MAILGQQWPEDFPSLHGGGYGQTRKFPPRNAVRVGFFVQKDDIITLKSVRSSNHRPQGQERRCSREDTKVQKVKEAKKVTEAKKRKVRRAEKRKDVNRVT